MKKVTNVFVLFIFSIVITGFAWHYSTLPVLANNSPSSVYDGVSPPGPVMNPSPIPCVGGETVLLIQDNVPWFAPLNQDSLGANVTELKAQNKTFCIINSNQVGAVNLNQFSEIILSAAQVQSFYNNLFPSGTVHPALASYVQNGGILSANLTDNASGPGAGGNWDGDTFISGLTHTNNFTDNNNITVPNHPIITGQFGGTNGGQITDTANLQDLDGWNVSSHGFFTNLPPDTITILSDSLNRPVLIEYPFGTGRVIASQVTNEWRYAGDFGSLPQNKKLLANEIGYQDSLICTPINPSVLANTVLNLAGNRQVALKDSPLAGLENVFVEQGCKHHVDPRLLVAIAAHESSLGLGFVPLHVNSVGQILPTDNGTSSDGSGRTWQWKFGTKFCQKFNPFGLLFGIDRSILECETNNPLFVGRPAIKYDTYTDAIEYLAELLAADWLYFEGDSGCPGSRTTVAGIADPANSECGYPDSTEEAVWRNSVTSFLQILGGDPNDIRNPAGFVQPRPFRIKSSFRILGDPADILITDPLGRRIGFDIDTQQIVNEIPEAVFSGRGGNPTKIDIFDPLAGEYFVKLTGTADAPYFFKTFAQNATGTFSRLTTEGNLVINETTEFSVQYSQEEGSFLGINLNIEPEVLNLKNRGVFTAFVTIPEGLQIDLKDIVTSTVSIVGVSPTHVQIANNRQLVAQFNRREFTDLFAEDNAEITLTASLRGGTFIKGIDTVKIINKTSFLQLSSLLANLHSALSKLLKILR